MTGAGGALGKGPVALAAEDFQTSVLEADIPVLVAFTAEWCAPCGWLKPYLEEFAAAAAGRMGVFTLDTDLAPGIATRYRIGSVPTVVFFRSGDEVDRSVGVEPDRLRDRVSRLVSAEGPA